MTRLRTYYAIEYAYGSDTMGHGGRGDYVASFRARSERDDWVAGGRDYVGPGERRRLLASSGAAKAHRWNLAHGIRDEEELMQVTVTAE